MTSRIVVSIQKINSYFLTPPTPLLLQVGNRVGVKRCSDDTMHIFLDGEDMGPAATAVAKVDTHAVHVYNSKLKN